MIIKAPILLHLISAGKEIGMTEGMERTKAQVEALKLLEADKYLTTFIQIPLRLWNFAPTIISEEQLLEAVRQMTHKKKNGAWNLNQNTNRIFRTLKFAIQRYIEKYIEDLTDDHKITLEYRYESASFTLLTTRTISEITAFKRLRHNFNIQLWQFDSEKLRNKKIDSIYKENLDSLDQYDQ